MAGFALLLMLGAQSQSHPPLVPGGEGLDLVTTQRREPECGSGGDEIVVCGDTDPNRFRLKPPAPKYQEPPVRARASLGGGELMVEAEQRSLPGAENPAAMVRLRLPIGKPKK